MTRARLEGAKSSTGDTLVFLDSHCEGNRDWIRPLLQRIKDSPSAVVTPMIDMIEQDTFEYQSGGYKNIEVISGDLLYTT